MAALIYLYTHVTQQRKKRLPLNLPPDRWCCFNCCLSRRRRKRQHQRDGEGYVCSHERQSAFYPLIYYIFTYSKVTASISDIFHVIDQPVMLKDLIPVPSRFGWVVLPLSCRIWQGFGQPGFHPICPYIFEIKVTSCAE